MKRSFALVLSSIALVGACSKSVSLPADTTSSIRGTVSVASFPSAPSAVEASDERGVVVRVPIAANGAFVLDLAKLHSYRFVVVLASAREPLVFPRAPARLDTTIRVSSGAASVDLGVLRHLSAAPPDGFFVVTPPNASTPKAARLEGEASDDECVDGKLTSTGAACADDDTLVSCDRGASNVDDQEAPADDTGSDADPTQPMVVGDRNAPDDVGGCDEGDGETNDGADPAD